MRIIIFLLLVSTSAIGQVLQETNGRRADRINVFKEGLRVPIGDTASTPFLLNYSGDSARGGIVYDTTLLNLCFWTGIRWVCVDDAGGGGGSTEYVVSGLGIKVDSSGRVYTVNSDTASSVVLSRQRAANTYALAGSTSPGGGLYSIQYNRGGSFSGRSTFVFDTANARVGIGIAAPTATLELATSSSNSSLRIGGIEIQQFALGNSWIADNAYFNGASFVRRATGTASLIRNNGGNMDFSIVASGAAASTFTPSAQVRFTAAGNIVNTGTITASGAITSSSGTSSLAALTLTGNVFKVGQITDETFTGSNLYTGANISFSSSAFRYNTSAHGVLVRYRDGQFLVKGYASGTAAAAVANEYNFKVTSSGEIGFGGAMPETDATFTNAKMFLNSSGQLGIGTITPATSAIVDISTTTGAVLLPRLTTTQRDALTATNGMILYNTTTGKLQAYAGGAWVDLH